MSFNSKFLSSFVQVCQSTGKLQLVDATGAFDVVVPDLRSLSNLHCVYQVPTRSIIFTSSCWLYSPVHAVVEWLTIVGIAEYSHCAPYP